MFSFLNPYIIIGALVALVGTYGVGRYQGSASCTAKYEYAAAKSKIAELELNAQVTERIRGLDSKKMADDADRIRDLQTKADENEKLLEDPNGSCFSDRDADRVRDIFRHKAP